MVDKELWDLPDVGPFHYLLQHLMDVGMSTAGDPLTWIEIQAWRELTLTPMLKWEISLLKHLSSAYVSAVRGFDGKNIQSPQEAKGMVASAVEDKLKNALSQLQAHRKDETSK